MFFSWAVLSQWPSGLGNCQSQNFPSSHPQKPYRIHGTVHGIFIDPWMVDVDGKQMFFCKYAPCFYGYTRIKHPVTGYVFRLETTSEIPIHQFSPGVCHTLDLHSPQWNGHDGHHEHDHEDDGNRNKPITGARVCHSVGWIWSLVPERVIAWILQGSLHETHFGWDQTWCKCIV